MKPTVFHKSLKVLHLRALTHMSTIRQDIRLIIDLGNTRGKAGVFIERELEKSLFFASIDELKASVPGVFVSQIFVSNVSARPLSELQTHFPRAAISEFERSLRLPIELDYETPNTVGLDRLAAAVAVNHEFKAQNVLSIDAGSCITYDLISSDGVFRGGAISPGVRMRLRAMHSMTGALPDLSEDWKKIPVESVGKSTAACMVSGAVSGVIDEMKGFLRRYRRDCGELTIIMTGGDAAFFESKLKEPIFVRPNLVLTGLNTIFDYNDH